MTSRFLRCTLASTVLVILVACSRQAPEGTDSGPQASPFVSALAATPFHSPLPSGELPQAPLLERDPTPVPGRGNVQGVLTIDGKPVAGRTLYLASIVDVDSPEMSGVASLDAVTAPRAESDRSGYFCFLDVQPAKYALGIDSPIGPVLIKRGASEIVAKVKENKITDLGEVKIVAFD